MKYKNCTQVIKAFKEGKINGVWQLDNDHSFIYDDDEEKIIFKGNAGNKLVLELLNIFGIPSKYV